MLTIEVSRTTSVAISKTSVRKQRTYEEQRDLLESKINWRMENLQSPGYGLGGVSQCASVLVT